MRRQRVTKPDEEPSSSQQESPPLNEEKIDKIELQMQQTTEIREMTQDILQLTTEDDDAEKNRNADDSETPVSTTSSSQRKAVVSASPPQAQVVIDADTTTRSAIERNPADSVETTTTKPRPTSKGHNSTKKNNASILSKTGAKVGAHEGTYGTGTKTSMRTKQANGKNQNEPSNTRLARNATIGAMAIDGPGFEDEPNQNTHRRTRDSNGIVTLTATAVEDDDAVEQRVRRQLLDQAVEAEVLGSDASSHGSVELPHDDEDAKKDLAPPPRRSRKCLWIAALVIFLLAGGVAGGIAGAALAVKNKGNNNKPPPPPKEDNGGGGGSGSNGGGGGSSGNKDKDGDDKDKDGGGGGGMMQNRRRRRQLLPNDLPPLPPRQVRKNQEMSGVSSETSMVGLRGQQKQPYGGGRR